MRKKLLGLLLVLVMVTASFPIVTFATDVIDNGPINQSYLRMLQEAFDNVEVPSDRARGCEMSFSLAISEALTDVFVVMEHIVYNIDIDSLEGESVFVRDFIHHPYFKDVLLVLYNNDNRISASIAYSICFSNEPIDVNPFSDWSWRHGHGFASRNGEWFASVTAVAGYFRVGNITNIDRSSINSHGSGDHRVYDISFHSYALTGNNTSAPSLQVNTWVRSIHYGWVRELQNVPIFLW